jgi:hypothetical protein
MGISRRDVFASLFGAGAAGAAIGTVAVSGQSNEPRVLSGADLGFRVEGTARDGAPMGTLVVRVDGKWVVPQFQPALRRAT